MTGKYFPKAHPEIDISEACTSRARYIATELMDRWDVDPTMFRGRIGAVAIASVSASRLKTNDSTLITTEGISAIRASWVEFRERNGLSKYVWPCNSQSEFYALSNLEAVSVYINLPYDRIDALLKTTRFVYRRRRKAERFINRFVVHATVPTSLP